MPDATPHPKALTACQLPAVSEPGVRDTSCAPLSGNHRLLPSPPFGPPQASPFPPELELAFWAQRVSGLGVPGAPGAPRAEGTHRALPAPPSSPSISRAAPPPPGPRDCALGRRARPGAPIIRSPGTHSPGALQSNPPHVSSSVSPWCPSSPRWPRGSHPSRRAQTLTPAGTGAPGGRGLRELGAETHPPPFPSSIPEPRRPEDPSLLVARPDWQAPPWPGEGTPARAVVRNCCFCSCHHPFAY